MTTTNSPAVSVRGLTKRFGSRTVVDQLDLDVPRGTVTGFVGPNGAGKTTTLAMLLGLVRPSGGTGEVLGLPLSDPGAFLPRVGALIEGPAFYPALSGRQNLRMVADVGGHDPARIDVVLEEVGLTDRDGDRSDDPYRHYSLGMKQRLGIAAGLLGDPELLMLDEPANGLDPEGVREMRALIGQMAQAGRTVLVSSHDLSELEQVCDWMVLMQSGRSLYQGSTADLLDHRGGDLRVQVRPLGGDLAPTAEVLLTAGYEVTVDGERLFVAAGPASPAGGPAAPSGADDADDADVLAAGINRAAFNAGITLAGLSPQRASLEERFLDLIGSSHER